MVLRRFLGAKLHMGRVTDANIKYEGSITIDEDLMDLVGITPYEFVLVSNANNGERFETYVIPGPRGSGAICLNGATARKGLTGDRVIVFSFRFLTPEEIPAHKPKIILLSEENKPIKSL
jgi:aspartate 1-decarboxylase